MKFTSIGAAVAGMFADKEEAERVAQARAERLPKIVEARGIITPELMRRIAADEMPECFELTREAYVAMAQLAYQALQLVEATVATIETRNGAPKH